jgi:hypothetical protein
MTVEGEHREVPEACLAAAQDDDRGPDGPERRADVAAYLKKRLRQAGTTARRHPGDARRLGVEHRGAYAEDSSADEKHSVRARGREDQQTDEREERADGQRERRRPSVGGEADDRLQERRRELVGERDESDLRKGQVKCDLQRRVDGEEQRLQHVVYQVTRADRQQNAVGGPLVVSGGTDHFGPPSAASGGATTARPFADGTQRTRHALPSGSLASIPSSWSLSRMPALRRAIAA